MFTQEILYDSSGRVKAVKRPGATSAGDHWEVHKWERLSGGTVEHYTALSADDQYSDTDASRRRTRSGLANVSLSGASTGVWCAVTETAAALGSGTWYGSATIERTALGEKAMTWNGLANYIPVHERVDGGMVTTTAILRERAAVSDPRKITSRTHRGGAFYRSMVTLNGLPTTFSSQDVSNVGLSHSRLREPLAEASFETIPWWPVLTRSPATGLVTARSLPRTGAAPGVETETYTRYPADFGIRSGQLRTMYSSSSGGTTRYDYNSRGQVEKVWGDGTHPQKYVYDGLGRMTELHTWRTSGGAIAWNSTAWPAAADSSPLKSVTSWSYSTARPTPQPTRKTYPAATAPGAAGGLNYVQFTYTQAGGISRRTSQRGIYTDYTYDAFHRLDLVNYSDTTPDVKFEYDPHSGWIWKRHDGWGTPGARTTTYTRRYDGLANSEVITGDSTLTLSRGIDSFGRLSSVGSSWASSSGGVPFTGITSPTATYSYTSNKLSTVYGSLNTVTMGGSWGGDSVSVAATNGGIYTISRSLTRDFHGRVTGHSASGPPASLSMNLRWDRDRLMARGLNLDNARWEYRYNVRGEAAQAWKQFESSTATASTGEVMSGTGSI